MRYLLGSGFIAGEGKGDFSRIWLANIKKYAKPEPSRIVVISAKGSQLPFVDPWLDEIQLSGDLGHFMDLVNGIKHHHFNGWMGAVLALAMIAYNDESDFIFQEADCLAFGPWVEELYKELGNAAVVFGRKHQGEPWQPCSQSLFLVRHSYIPEFVRLILSTDAQSKEGELGEHKFERMNKEYPEQWKMFGFPFDREKPIDMTLPVFYAQQWTEEELDEARQKGLI